MSQAAIVRAFFHEPTNTVSYLVIDPATKQAAVIDPVLDYDQASGEIDTLAADEILSVVKGEGVRLVSCLETHAHADHLSASPYIKQHTGAKIGIGARITEVQEIFAPMFGITDIKPDGADFDYLFEDGARFSIGALEVSVLHTPGHTPADITYRIDDMAFVGDTIFMPDFGTARADFPGGDAHQLYQSIQRLLDLPAETRIFTCHDYKAPGRDTYAWETSVADQRAGNVHLKGGVNEADFVAMREARDKDLPTPKLLLPSIQVNIRAGNLPEPAQDGTRFLKIPLRFKAQST
jgi:glyoxylase-like metal-dependent hydrolase (beta-lactamase superfamily II)